MKNFAYILIVISATSLGTLIRVPFEGIRPTGMGNAFISISDDVNALWYNPAGLARVRGAHFDLFNFSTGVDSMDTLSRMYDGVMNGNSSDLLRQDTQYMRISTMPTLIVPYFGLSIYQHLNSFTKLEDLMDEIDIYAFNDLGAIAGFGIPFGDYLSVGASVRIFQRSGVDIVTSAQELLKQVGLNSTNFLDAAFTHLRDQMGTGWAIGLNVGAMLRVPLAVKSPKWTIAATAEDFGQTTFKKLGTTNTPTPILTNYSMGTSVQYDLGKSSKLNIAAEMHHLLEEETPINQMIHLGIEYRHPIWAIRAGAYQGYPTFGFSIETPPHTKIHFSTYATELGSDWWEANQRWYGVQVVIGFNPI